LNNYLLVVAVPQLVYLGTYEKLTDRPYRYQNVRGHFS